MSKNTELDKLFDEWAHHGYGPGKFVRDGIVNEGLWNKKPKVLFLLKETNGNDKKYAPLLKEVYSNDLRLLWDVDQWNKIGYLGSAIHEVTTDFIPDFDSAKKNYKEACKRLAVVNLKKSSGGSLTDSGELFRHFKDDKSGKETANTKREIEIIGPDIIIFGGVFDIVMGLEMFGKKYPISERVYRFERLNESIVGIDFVHPNARVAGDILYYALAKIYQNYLRAELQAS